jgi:hypothetical protein
MRPEVEMIVAQDSSVTGMFNWCVLVAARPDRGMRVIWFAPRRYLQSCVICSSFRMFGAASSAVQHKR